MKHDTVNHSIVWCKVHFDISNHLGITYECDRQTDILLANAALNYVKWPKTTTEITLCCCTLFPVQQAETPANVSVVCEAFNAQTHHN